MRKGRFPPYGSIQAVVKKLCFVMFWIHHLVLEFSNHENRAEKVFVNEFSNHENRDG